MFDFGQYKLRFKHVFYFKHDLSVQGYGRSCVKWKSKQILYMTHLKPSYRSNKHMRHLVYSDSFYIIKNPAKSLNHEFYCENTYKHYRK